MSFARLRISSEARGRSLGPQELADFAWSFAALRWHNGPLLAEISSQALRMIWEFRAQELAATAWSYASLACCDTTLLAALSSTSTHRILQFDVPSLASTAWAFSRLVVADGPLLDGISAAAIARIVGAVGAGPSELAQTAWSCARLALRDGPLLEMIASRTMITMAECNPQECGNIAWAFATLRWRDWPLFDAIAAQALSKIAQFGPQNLANTAWAWAALRCDHAPLRAALSAAAMPRLELFGAHELASTAWSCATLAVSDAPLLHGIAAEALVKISQFAPQEIGNTSWSFSTLSFYHEPLLDGIAYAASARIHQFKSQELSNTVWSLAVFRVRDRPLLEAIAAAAVRSIRPFRQQELANTAWAFAKLLFLHLPLLDAIALAAIPSIRDWGPQELANTAWAFARLRVLDTTLLQAISSALLARLAKRQPGSFRAMPRHVEMVMWALSRQSGLAPAWSFLDGLEGAGWHVGSQAVAGLLGECERRGLVQRQVQLLHLLARSEALAAPARAVAAALLGRAGGPNPGGAPGSPSSVLWGACFGGSLAPLSPAVARGLLAQPPRPGREHEKEARLLAFVLSTAPPSRPEAICEAIERFGYGNLSRPHGGEGGWAPSAGQWLKVAGGDKAAVLSAAARLAPSPGAGRTLEIGTYCGYSSMRLAAARPGSVVVTLESNPANAVIARCIVGYAGLADVVDVRVGHSEDVLPQLAAAAEKDSGAFDLVFFDQRGSRYAADLAALQRGRLLAERAVVVADNVLKPGAPEFLWEVLRSGCFHTQVVSVSEYAMPGVEDWMSLSVHVKPEERRAPPLPRSLRRMEWEADQIRSRAERFPGVSFKEWAGFAARMRDALAVFGIGPSSEQTSPSRP